MKKRMLMIMILATGFLLMACSGGKPQVVEEAQPEKESEDATAVKDEEIDSVDLGEVTGQEQVQEESDTTKDPLATYPSEKIEYARVWLQMIGKGDVEELNVQHISAGEQLNPYDDKSVAYPEDVIVLTGKASADGTVTYSGNGDGTINVYDVPSHWPSSEQIEESMEEYTQGIVDDAEKVSVDAGDEEEVVGLIGKISG
ncbi:hypothetical protein LCD52_12535 [Rossellomorea vietnamensis]|uniref:hypothetical protein n=1 Tax=Rossellomorea vietnamensis TaxID=218284 RepID=UPI001CCA71E7|nr:hypothetical protein [Rossellomorea vietnamensis]MCA0149622.1 hypothetical protein [Rossellomorea vietnamensis]